MISSEKWLKNSTLGEIITNDIRFDILNGKIAQEEIITENKISKLYETSRSPVREAFKTLSTEGLIELRRMGASVRGLTENDIHEIYDVRFLIEGFCIKKFSTYFNQEQSFQLKKMLDNMALSAKYEDYEDFAYYDFLFHEFIIKQSNHSRMFYLWNNIRYIVLCLLIISTKLRFMENKKQNIDSLISNHELIIDGLVSKDSEYLDKVIWEHCLDTKNTVIPYYFKNLENNSSHVYK